MGNASLGRRFSLAGVALTRRFFFSPPIRYLVKQLKKKTRGEQKFLAMPPGERDRHLSDGPEGHASPVTFGICAS